MTCDHAQTLVALAASGDAGDRELGMLERHVEACDRCAAFRAAWRPLPLRDLRAELPFDDEMLAEVRGRVMEKVTAEREAGRGWGVFLLRTAAVIAAFAILVIGVRLRIHRDADVVRIAAHNSSPIGEAAAPHRPQVVAPVAIAPAPIVPPQIQPDVRRHHRHRREPARTERVEVASAALPDSPGVPIHMEIYTSDPNVRIIWIATPEADSDPAPTPNRSK